MQNLFKFDKLNFITAGMPLRTGKGSYPQAFNVLKEMNLDGMELEFVHGVRMSDTNRDFVKNMSKDFIITAHGPFYINLNSQEEEKIDASLQRIIDTASVASEAGAFSITYHAAFYMGKDKETVTNNSITYNTVPSRSLMNDRKGGTTSLDRNKSRFKKVVNFVKDNKEVVSVLASVVLALASKNNDLDGKK